MHRVIEKIRAEFRCNPSLGPLLLFGLGVLGGVCEFGWRGWFRTVHISFWVAWLFAGRRWWMAWSLFLLGAWWGWRAVVESHDSYVRLMGREECRVNCKGVVVGSPLAGEPLDFAVHEMETADGWRRCSGLVRLRTDGVFDYGDTLHVIGGLTYPDAGGYRRHLRTLGIRHELTVEKIEKTGQATGWRQVWAQLLKKRDRMGGWLTEGFVSERLSGLYLAMVMGRRDLFPQADREAFVRSATIHVFAISGLHVNCLLLAICLLLRSMCLSKRMALFWALPLTASYVLLTGAGPSSMRAIIMLSGGVLALCLYRRWSNRHVFCLAALGLLLINPLYILNIGFQFSFLIVGVLVFSQPMQGEVEQIMTERWRWRLRTTRRMAMFRLMKRVLGVMVSCCLAWWGGLALTFHVNHLLPLGALVVNMAVQPLAALMVEGAVPKILLACVWKKGSCLLGGGLERCMEWMVRLAEWGGRAGVCWETDRLPGGIACLYVAFLAVLFAGYGNKTLRWMMWLGMGAIIVNGLSGRLEKTAEVRLFRADTGNRTCMIVLNRGWREAVVLMPGCGASARLASRWLKENGVTMVGGLFADGGIMARGAQEWIQNMTIRSAVLGERWLGTAALCRLTSSGTHVMYWRKAEGKKTYRHGHVMCTFTDGVEGGVLRFEEKNGLRISYNEGKDGMVLLSFIGRGGSGNIVLNLGMCKESVRLPLK